MVKRITIVGGGSAGWMTAAHLAQTLPGVEITLVESPNVPIIGVGESTVPPIVDFMASLGLKEQDWMPACKATYKSSICFRNFHGTDGKTMWFPFSGTWSVAGRPAAQHWLYRYFTDPAFNDRFSIYDYCTLVPEICRQGKTVRSLPNATYAYHLDAIALGERLKVHAKGKGVKHVQALITQVTRREDGAIDRLELDNGEALTADLFVDCSGFRSMLLAGTLEEPFEYYTDALFNDKAIALRLPFDPERREAEMVSYTLCTALSSGWVWTIPLYNRLGTGYVYSSRHLEPDQAETEFRGFLKELLGDDRADGLEAKHLDIRVGKHRRTWVKNCVAIGLSAGFVEPLESTGLQIVQSQVHLLAETLRARGGFNIADVNIYNKSIRDLLDSIKDFLVCHYALTEREDTPYWKDVKYTTEISDALAEKLTLARSVLPAPGNLQRFDTGGALAGFGFNDGWYYILVGMGHLPFAVGKQREMGVGIFDAVFQKHAAEAQQMADRLKAEHPRIGQLPSHYRFLRDNIYGGAEE
ncbi:tryptophan halogenase family protein [Thiohalobacter sp.]|uniref:tryptophan halogenase family protein n=1 Tax=Thiohalobacter sp. TaxID=2025948 RepID=UPI002607EBA4|nr:tryptophan halogenase family protein [Thiohalobacter sp.]